MGGSLLKNFKSDLQKSDLLRHQKKKAKHGNNKDRRERDRKAAEAIRQGFNPFDVKQTRQRFQTTGVAGQVGKPGISKQIGEQQRKRAYDAQKRIRNKVGGLLDRRFGENDKNMSEEDRMVARYAKERLRQTRKSQFSLDDDADNETLTHGGNALAFDDFDEADLQDEEQEQGRLYDERHQNDAGFDRGGAEGTESEEPERKKSKHEVMQEIIQKSKMHKAQRQNEKAELEGMVEELNDPEAFKELMADLHQYDEEHNPQTAKTSDASYDQMIREMAFDRRAVPEDRTKTEEELEEEAAEKAKQQLAARQQRLEGDDLGDDFQDYHDDAHIFGLHHESGDESEEELEDLEDQVESNIPKTVDGLAALIENDPVPQLRKLIKSVDPSKGAGNKAKLARIVQLMCKYMTLRSQHFNALLPLVRKHAQSFEESLGQFFRAQVDKIHARSPKLTSSDLMMLTLIGCLFSTSDQWHLVANAATLVITQYLFQQVDLSDAKSGIFLTQVVLMYQRISKRYVPEAVAYVLRVLAAATGDSSAASLVRLASTPIELRSFEYATLEPISLSSKLSSDQLVLAAVHNVDIMADLYKASPAYAEIFIPLVGQLAKLPENHYVQATLGKIEKKLKFFAAERRPLRLQELRPVSIVTQAPMFDDNFNPEAKYRDMNPERREIAKMRAELKRERKGTLKEIRRDAEFETREKLFEKRKEASDYHTMLQKLTDQIQNEEGAEKNRYEREKLKRKRK